MKRKIITALIALTLLIVAVPINTPRVQAADIVTVIVDGRTIEFPDAPAYLDENGRTQVPSRFIGEALGAYVEWNEDMGSVTLSRFSRLWGETGFAATEVVFRIGHSTYNTRVGDKSIFDVHFMDTDAVLNERRTYVPVRYVADAFGATTDWDEATRTVTITSRTKTIGEFVVPESYTDNAAMYDYEDGLKFTQFGINMGRQTYAFATLENRMQISFDVMLQVIGQDTLDMLWEYMMNEKAFTAKDKDNHYRESIFDVKSGRYVGIVTEDRSYFWINIYDEGCMPYKP